MAGRRLPPLTYISISIAALGAWVSAGALSLASSHHGAARLAILPSGLWLAASAAIALLLTVTIGGSWTTALSVAAVLLLPWLPLPVPPVFYLWVGHLRVWVWIAIASMIAVPLIRKTSPPALAARVRDPRQAPRLAAIVAALLYLAGAYQVFPQLPGGDEPHYLVITQSLLNDHDLKVENNYAQGDYHAYFAGSLHPDYLRRGQDGEIYSIHAPGVAALVAPVFALSGYPGVVTFLAILSGCAGGLAWIAAWRATHDAAAAWFGWASTALSMPFFFQSFVVYPEAPAAAIVVVAVLTLMEGSDASVRRLCSTGVALALLPWLHVRLALIAAAFGVLLAVRQLPTAQRLRRIGALLVVPAISAACWFAFFHVIYGTIDPRAPYAGSQQSALSNVPRGLIGLAFDQQFGALPNAPVYLCAALGCLTLVRLRRRLAIELLIVALPYLVLVAGFDMWWAGSSSAARLLTPVLLMAAIPAAAWFHAARGRASRLLGLGALAVSLMITATIALVDRGNLLYNAHDGMSRLLRWLSPLVDLTTGVPSLFQNDAHVVLVHAAIWLGAVALTAAAARRIARWTPERSAQAAAIGLVAAICGMTAITLVWRSNNARPLTPTSGSIELLKAFESSRVTTALQYPPLERLAPTAVPPRLVVAAFPFAGPPRMDPANDLFIEMSHAPAATYALDVSLRRPGAGVLSVVVDRRFGPAWQWNLAGSYGSLTREFQLPVPTATIAVDGDAAARAAVAGVTLRAVAASAPAPDIGNREPWHIVREGSAVVFVMDGGRGYVEPGGVWVGGESFLDLVIAPDEPARQVHVSVRNPRVENLITIDADAWHRSSSFAPGEERAFDIPLPPGERAVPIRVTSAQGIRPADFEHGNTDTRLLGCWLSTR